jgi:tetratricopeptide (TPR) repeat protein
MRLSLILGLMVALAALMMPACGQGTAEEWYNKGWALGNQGKYAEAIQAYDEAIRLDPEDAGPWNDKGSALYNLGKYAEAIQAYDEAIRLDPGDAIAWYNKGSALD